MSELEVTVQSILPSEEPQGRFHIRIQRDATVGDLLKQLCKEANVPVLPEYSLRSKGRDLLSREDTLLHCEVEDGAFLHWTSEDVVVTSCVCNTLLSLAILSFIIGVAGIATICAIRFKPLSSITDFAIVFDAGSTHTSMFVYKWEGSKYHGTAVAAQFGDTCNAKGHGIASFENNPSAAGASLDDCLKKAESIIPDHKHAQTPVYLGATAGMRLLNMSNPVASEAILKAVRDTFAKSPFNVLDAASSVRIITGADEGTFSWVTSNYLTNAFNVEKPWVKEVSPRLMYSSVGALDLGGASTQITFIPEQGTKMPTGYSHAVKLYGKSYNVYTHSYLCYGVVQMVNTLLAELIKESNSTDATIAHPCLPEGYKMIESYDKVFSSPCVAGVAESKDYSFLGSGNVGECRALLDRTLFKKTSCPYTQCSFNGVYQPTVQGPFYAFSTFYYLASFLNLTETSSSTYYASYENALSNFCNKTWEEMEKMPVPSDTKPYLMWYCLEGIYISDMLHNNYNFTQDEWPMVNFVKKVSGSDVGWTLGFILDASDSYAVHKPSPEIYPWTFALLMVLFCLFIVVSIGLLFQSRKVSHAAASKYSRITSYGAI